jgi:hypothetical protein
MARIEVTYREGICLPALHSLGQDQHVPVREDDEARAREDGRVHAALDRNHRYECTFMGWFCMVITAELFPCCLASLSEDFFFEVSALIGAVRLASIG